MSIGYIGLHVVSVSREFIADLCAHILSIFSRDTLPALLKCIGIEKLK